MLTFYQFEFRGVSLTACIDLSIFFNSILILQNIKYTKWLNFEIWIGENSYSYSDWVIILYLFFCQVLYIALPAILDTNPFQDTDEDSDKKPQEVETVISIFQTTYNVVKAYSVHEDIIHQLFAYLFFFTNASLFNTLMERGAGGKFYRWAKGAQIRGNLDLLESWALQVQLQEEANDYLNRLSTAADLLATPKVQLLQVCY